ncbi:MAG TPA: hypothetical protein VMS45_03825, partial [Gemmatimonadaceae bacterium]|nr:hypothetical protein [Gemmatimonadaceae bacterium]
MTHRTVEGAMRAIESALENSDRWLVERSDDMLAMRPIYRRATSLSEFYFEWGWMNQYQGWIVPF